MASPDYEPVCKSSHNNWGNAGLGFNCGHQLLSYNLSHLILAVRSAQKGKIAATKLQTSYPNAIIEIWALDMSSYDSIMEFAQHVRDKLTRLDIVILNAGIGKAKFDIIPSTGHEEDIQINYLSTAFLSLVLLPVAKAKSPAGISGRLTIVTSALAYAAKFPNKIKPPLLPSFDDPKSFVSRDQYCLSKLLAHLFVYKLVDYVSSDDVVVNLVDPGLVKGTELGRGTTGIASKINTGLGAISGRSVDVGSSTYLDAVLVKGKSSHGCFLMNWKIAP
ncbi:hypothetical protein F5884DRAFT_876057 [Xylogone sp. PMI_703]|nr:hypothetical protein F5884DRAFT_876057 [Xylogone sp. PMI_703]